MMPHPKMNDRVGFGVIIDGVFCAARPSEYRRGPPYIRNGLNGRVLRFMNPSIHPSNIPFLFSSLIPFRAGAGRRQ
jgi:hypothetical protein